MNLFKAMLVMLAMGTGLAAFAFSGGPARAELKAGAATADITPEWPVYLGGYYYVNTRSKGVHDPLHARILALNDGQNTVVMISLDVVIMGGVFATELKQMIQDKLGIPPENITVSATHTHTGPEGYYEEFGKYPKEYDPNLKHDMQNKTLAAVVSAVEGMKPAQAAVTTLSLPEFMSNRHNPDGPEDPTAVLLVIRDMEGKPFTGFLNMPSHATSAPAEQLLVSAGWPGQFTAEMEKKLGEGSTFVYIQGAAGNISPRGTEGDDAWQGIHNYGVKLSGVVWDAIGKAGPGTSDFPVAGALKKFDNVPVRRKKSTMEFAAKMNDRIKEIEASDLSPEVKERQIGWQRERLGIENFMQPMIQTMKRVKDGRTGTVVQALRLGDTLVAAFPGEAIAEVSIEMRKRLAPKTVAVFGYCNDHLGYLTTNEVYEQGGYEAGMGLVYPEATYKFMDTAEELAKSLEEGQ